MSFKFESLDVWKRSIDFTDELFSIADNLHQKYQFSIGEQLRRASLSVPTNIAEGSGRDSIKEKQYFFRIAKGSIYEVVSLMIITGKRNCLSRETYRRLYDEANEIAAILSALSKHAK